MRVKITRTVDVEEVPSVVEKIAADCRQLLQLQASRMNTAMHDIPKMVEVAAPTGTYWHNHFTGFLCHCCANCFRPYGFRYIASGAVNLPR